MLKNPVKGQVCTQNPVGRRGSSRTGTTVTLHRLRRAAGRPVQHVVGLSYAEAQQALAGQGLVATGSTSTARSRPGR